MSQREEQLRERLRQATMTLREVLLERDSLQAEKDEPIAIVGIGCRFPGGASTPQKFWEFLDAGRNAIVSLEPRWTLFGARPREKVPHWAGLLAEPVDEFDAAFFGISPREARSLDPQQRLLLEVTWEALENAGIPLRPLDGSNTGVFVGACSTDYLHAVYRQPREDKDAYGATGNMLSIAAGRLSYALGLQGPCIALDTACSSSLVTVHLACRSLRARESNLALAGGVNLLLSPETMDALARTQALSPDGRCKTFDASANGFVRGEGCGIVVLKRLSDAQRDGDRIWALIRGSAVNQDGRSTGLTAPNVKSQEALLREALRSARAEAQDIGYVETHGTGTSLGDPIEVEALRTVLGAPRSDRSRCVLGALKTNIGHLEGAAGVAGLIKAVLALQHGRIPKNLNFRALNAHIEIEGTALALATDHVPWPPGERRRLAGVSSFGLSGTNAHVILEEAPEAVPGPASPTRSAELFVLSARSEAALSAQAARLHLHLLAHPHVPLGDLAYSLASSRSPLEHRLSIHAASRSELLDSLVSAAQGNTPLDSSRGKIPDSGLAKVVFVFAGQGSQWLGMARRLLDQEPVFAEALGACDLAIAAEAGFSILSELTADQQSERIDVVQPVLFALGVGLAALWRSWGVQPAAVVGHSMGEVTAAHVAGALSLQDAVAIICRRSRLLRRLSGQGQMALVELSLAEASAALTGYEDRLSVAVSNSPRSTVIAGEPAALAEILFRLEQQGLFCRRLNVDVAGHSLHVEPLLEELRLAIPQLSPQECTVPMYSTNTGTWVKGRQLVANYWVQNLRNPVRFADAVEGLFASGHRLFIEMSPHPLLIPWIEEMAQGLERQGAAVGSLGCELEDRAAMLGSLGALWVHGVAPAWEKVFLGGGHRVELPGYAWQRQRYWVETAAHPDAQLPAVETAASAAASGGGGAGADIDEPATSQLAADQQSEEDDWYLGMDWLAAPGPTHTLPAGRWLLVGGSQHSASLLQALSEAGHSAVHIQSLPDSLADIQALLFRAFPGACPTAVVLMSCLDLSPASDSDLLGPAISQSCNTLLLLLQGLVSMAYRDPPRLWVLSRGAQPVADSPVSLSQTALLGLLRVIALEHPEFRVVSLDLDPRLPHEPLHRLPTELLADDQEQEIALRGHNRWVARLARKSPETGSQCQVAVAAARPFQLEPKNAGVLERMLRELLGKIGDGLASQLAQDTQSLGAAGVALRKLASSEHLGKLVLTVGNDEVKIKIAAAGKVLIRSDASYLVTGGLGGLGLSVAAWLASKGAGQIVLVGRSAPHSSAQKDAIEKISALGSLVQVVQADIAERSHVIALLNNIDQSALPLRGIVHAAGVLDDGLLIHQSPDRFDKVFRPKVYGALNLHELTQKHELDLFVLYSSAAGLLGSPGQGNYAAANTFLDGLAHHRRLLGLPALSIDWGPFAEIGLAAAQDNRGARLAAQGLRSLKPEEGLRALERLLQSGHVQVGVVPLNLRQWLGLNQAATSSRKLSRLVAEGNLEAVRPAGDQALLERLAGADPKERPTLLLAILREQVARVLRTSTDKLDQEASLTSLGMDSLMGLELRNRIEGLLGLAIPAMAIWSAGNTTGLARYLAERIFETQLPAAAASIFEHTNQMVADLNQADTLPNPIAIEPNQITAPRAVLLTGSTGFVGAYLAERLLRNTRADLYCPIRAPNDEIAMSRLQRNFQQYGLWREEYSSRLRAIASDLGEPRFGLSEELFANLANKIDVVYHNAAQVDWVRSYQDLRAPNVLATLEMLRFCAMERGKPLHYVSTMGAITQLSIHPLFAPSLPQHPGQHQTQLLDTPYLQRHGLSLGYTQSKWVADEIVLRARQHGYAASIYRLPFVIGDSETGACTPRDYLLRLIKTCVDIGAAPAVDGYADMVPVDVIAELIVDLAAQKQASGRVFDIASTRPQKWSTLIRWLEQKGYRFEPLDPAAWLKRIRDSRRADDSAGLYPLLPMLEGLPPDQLFGFISYPSGAILGISQRTTQRFAAPERWAFAERLERVMSNMLGHLQKTGFLSPPVPGSEPPSQSGGNFAERESSPPLLSSASQWREWLLAQLFSQLEPTASGRLDWTHLAARLRVLQRSQGWPESSADSLRMERAFRGFWSELVEAADADRDACLAESDLRQLASAVEHGVLDQGKVPVWAARMCAALFAMFDVDGDLQISLQDYQRFVDAMGLADAHQQSFQRIDLRGAGALRLDEFQDVFVQLLM